MPGNGGGKVKFEDLSIKKYVVGGWQGVSDFLADLGEEGRELLPDRSLALLETLAGFDNKLGAEVKIQPAQVFHPQFIKFEPSINSHKEDEFFFKLETGDDSGSTVVDLAWILNQEFAGDFDFKLREAGETNGTYDFAFKTFDFSGNGNHDAGDNSRGAWVGIGDFLIGATPDDFLLL